MKKLSFFIAILLLFGSALFAQVSINNDNSLPNSSAMLDVQSTNKGFLPPRISLIAIDSPDPVTTPATGLLVFNTAEAGTPPNNVTAGYYCWNGTRWVSVIVPEGANIGDMLYWNGAQWVGVPAGSNGQVLTFNNGVPTWGGIQLPILNTTEVSGNTPTSAVSGGNISSDGGSLVTERGVCWSTSALPTIADNHTSDGTGTGNYTSILTGLMENTSYFTRAYATNSIGTSYGNQILFSTSTTLPTVTTAAITNITQTTASGGGNVSFDGGATVTAKGICWGITSNPTIAGDHTTDGNGTDGFTSSLTGLTPGIYYYVRAYATNSVGTSYGNQLTFSALPNLPTLSTTPITNITPTTAESGGNVTHDGGATVTARGICWDTVSNPTITGSHTMDGIGTGVFLSQMTGLVDNTTYYVRAYATNQGGTAYGNEISFTTIQIFYIGQNYGGGIVFYIDGTGQHGLIAAPADISEGAPWGCWDNFIGATDTAIGTGQANTTAIVNGCSQSGIAARICVDLVLNGHDDWFLPSIDELMQMQNIIWSGGRFWSSSESSAKHAYNKEPNSINKYISTKYTNYRVRAVRAF